jgi:hypothetical protein
MTGKAIRGVGLLCLPLVSLALVSALSTPPAHAADSQPVRVYQNPTEGEAIRQPAFGIQLRFSSPDNFKDMDTGGGWAFTVTEGHRLGFGNRDVFEPDGYGVTIYPAQPIGEITGQWNFHDRLTSADARSSSSPATASPTPEPGATTPAAVSASPAPTSGHSSVSSTPNATSPIAAGSSGGPDILKYSLLTIGAAGAAGVILLIGYLVRRRVGYDPHREMPSGGDDHH